MGRQQEQKEQIRKMGGKGEEIETWQVRRRRRQKINDDVLTSGSGKSSYHM